MVHILEMTCCSCIVKDPFAREEIGSYAELGASPEEDLENGLFADELHLSPDGICSLWRSTLEAPTSPTMMRGSVLAAPLTHNLHSLKRTLIKRGTYSVSPSGIVATWADGTSETFEGKIGV
ncbi:unnamed protein product [Cladocopium goreaui]|uniref:Uncharacterized protein n=1 Tax=Cladocopium goreaui TaxID=2562237 RepID=A0A9P1D528_9DINO|nr:unnamed protein product [Cladocopium goreaui]